MKKSVLVVGCNGRMGQLVCDAIKQSEDFYIFGGFDKSNCTGTSIPVYSSLNEIIGHPDLIIDFSSPDATFELLMWAQEYLIPIVIATTGFTDNQKLNIKSYARTMPIFMSSNMSYEVSVFLFLAKYAASLLPGCDIEITESHHRAKKDSPSGTAKLIFESLNEALDGKMFPVYGRSIQRRQNEIGISSIRGGSISGTHTVHFLGDNENFSMTHEALNPKVFADGALNAARYLLKKDCGFYTTEDLVSGQFLEVLMENN